MLKVFLLIVVGLGGDAETAKTFHRWSNTLAESSERLGVPPDRLVYLVGEPVEGDKNVSGRATKEEVTKALTKFAGAAGPEDVVFIALIGHGSFDGRAAKFNMPGPDMGPEDFEPLLKKLQTKQLVFVNTASASGAFLQPLAAPGRVIVTATKTGGERNETDFPEYFVAAYNDDSADLDRNGHISVREAFDYAAAKVKQAFQQKGYMLTEHATLEDGEGQLAATVFLGTGRADAALNVDLSDPAAKALVEERDAIEKDIAGMRLMKPSMEAAAYDAKMEKLLTDLALKTKALRDLQAKKAKP